MMYDVKKIGENIIALRKQKELSQEDLAEKLFVSRQAVSKWERGEALPDTENLIALSELFDVSIDALIKGEPKPKNESEVFEENANSEQFIEKPIDDTIFELQQTGDQLVEEMEEKIFSLSVEIPASNKQKSSNSQRRLSWFWHAFPYPIFITIVFFLWGFFGGWDVAWTLYITIPVYYSFVECIQMRKWTPFDYPVLVTFLYCLFGMLFSIWHPLWVIFLTIPIYYPIAEAIDRNRRRKGK